MPRTPSCAGASALKPWVKHSFNLTLSGQLSSHRRDKPETQHHRARSSRAPGHSLRSQGGCLRGTQGQLCSSLEQDTCPVEGRGKSPYGVLQGHAQQHWATRSSHFQKGPWEPGLHR